MKVILLGTGCPGVRMNGIKANASEAIIIDDDILLFDCGRWVSYRLAEAKIKPWHVNYLFFTHVFHFDHMCDFPTLIFSRYLGREGTAWNLWENTKKMSIFGPNGTKAFSEGVMKAFSVDFRAEIVWKGLNVTDVTGGIIVKSDSWSVLAVATTHFSPQGVPSLAYRIDSKEASIVISGDITWRDSKEENFLHNPNLIQLAKGVDVFIIDTDDTHTSTEAVARLLVETKPKTAVLTHLQNPGPLPPRIGETHPRNWPRNDELKQMIKTIYDGEVIIGEDLKTIAL